jgi:hypothetical protein
VDTVSDEMAAKLAIFAGVVITIAISIVLFFVSRLSISREKQTEINAALEKRYAGEQAESDPEAAAAGASLVPNG